MIQQKEYFAEDGAGEGNRTLVVSLGSRFYFLCDLIHPLKSILFVLLRRTPMQVDVSSLSQIVPDCHPCRVPVGKGFLGACRN